MQLPEVEPAVFLAPLQFLCSPEVMTTQPTAEKHGMLVPEAHRVEFQKSSSRPTTLSYC